jgi:hypothetical protein
MRKGISTNAAGGDPELKTPGFFAALSDLSKSEFLCHIHAPRVRGFHAWSPQGVKVDRGMRPCPCADGLESSIKASQVVWCFTQEHSHRGPYCGPRCALHGKDNLRSATRCPVDRKGDIAHTDGGSISMAERHHSCQHNEGALTD